jgi:hypothetical protein
MSSLSSNVIEGFEGLRFLNLLGNILVLLIGEISGKRQVMRKVFLFEYVDDPTAVNKSMEWRSLWPVRPVEKT